MKDFTIIMAIPLIVREDLAKEIAEQMIELNKMALSRKKVADKVLKYYNLKLDYKKDE